MYILCHIFNTILIIKCILLDSKEKPTPRKCTIKRNVRTFFRRIKNDKCSNVKHNPGVAQQQQHDTRDHILVNRTRVQGPSIKRVLGYINKRRRAASKPRSAGKNTTRGTRKVDITKDFDYEQFIDRDTPWCPVSNSNTRGKLDDQSKVEPSSAPPGGVNNLNNNNQDDDDNNQQVYDNLVEVMGGLSACSDVNYIDRTTKNSSDSYSMMAENLPPPSSSSNTGTSPSRGPRRTSQDDKMAAAAKIVMDMMKEDESFDREQATLQKDKSYDNYGDINFDAGSEDTLTASLELPIIYNARFRSVKKLKLEEHKVSL